ncbi:TATA box-binding protein-associated factor RNA polymerase I subunit D isoform X2 [Mus caroli]|uniref:TATA box-binding protein-associated factor RNA polymerase I subunit D n=1 Tax=Mus caroli TaxID=10089 RepID=A0A6P7RSB3_MUSCR|nr:TATA box-binding protein-associated factor RNA polymerase I subunit D isoform X2 [Mus caroli]XP_029338016.1 TATA box-binding protein-associated factor RNA polymerase I subunit D isoform X2 [Mus caroli]
MAQSEVNSAVCVASDTAGDTGNQSDDSSDGSLFKTQCVPSPTQEQRHPTVKRATLPASVETDTSSDSSIEPRPLTLKAIFERFKKKKRKKRKRRKKRKYEPKLRPRGRPSGTRNTRRSQIDAKQIKDKGAVFPFLESESGRKPLPWKKILTYEQAVARGFFHHIEKLKYEHHLKECLKEMHAGEDLEKEDLDTRRHKYMDDDGSLSPIEEPLTEDEATSPQSECDIKLVEDSCFIISSEFPRKRNLEQEKMKKESKFSKKAKDGTHTQKGHRRTLKGDDHVTIEEGLP